MSSPSPAQSPSPFECTDLSWLPSDAEEQLSLGFRIISNAYKTRVQSLDAENRSLKHQVEDSKQAVIALQRQHNTVEVELIETRQKQYQMSEENSNLVHLVKQLQKQVVKLETLKRAVLTTLHEDKGKGELEIEKMGLSTDFLISCAPHTMQESYGNE